jgi:hypothetical protein
MAQSFPARPIRYICPWPAGAQATRRHRLQQWRHPEKYGGLPWFVSWFLFRRFKSMATARCRLRVFIAPFYCNHIISP